jgi:hypothetical protein
MGDAGTFEFWQNTEQPPAAPQHVDCGTFEYWQNGELPPVLDNGTPPAIGGAAPDRGWGWGWQGTS